MHLAARLVLAGAVVGFVGVAAGAFGAHTLAGRVAPERLVTFETGARYAVYHALALALTGAAAAAGLGREARLRWAGRLFAAGVGLFSGSLWLLVLTGVRYFGAITPLGGVSFLAAWALLAAAVWPQIRTPERTGHPGAERGG